MSGPTFPTMTLRPPLTAYTNTGLPAEPASSTATAAPVAERPAAEPDALPPASLAWYERFHIKGDLRLRYQGETAEGDDEIRNRFRFRLRLGTIIDLADGLTMGVGLASGSGDPRSNNQTLEGSFESFDLRLDYAFLQYETADIFTIAGGKIKNPFWRAGGSDLLWDSDIHQTGGMFRLGRENNGTGGHLTVGAFILDEIKTGSDPWMIGVQSGLKASGDTAWFELAFGYYGFFNVQGGRLDYSEETNTYQMIRNAAGEESPALRYGYHCFTAGLELGFKLGGSTTWSFFGEFIRNSELSAENNGVLAGTRLTFFDDLLDLSYSHRYMQSDAWLDIFPDSDFRGGGTNAQGHEVILGLNVHKNFRIGFDYYHTRAIAGESAPDHLWQFDLMGSF